MLVLRYGVLVGKSLPKGWLSHVGFMGNGGGLGSVRKGMLIPNSIWVQVVFLLRHFCWCDAKGSVVDLRRCIL